MLPYLLNGHHNLNGVQAVQSEVIREVRGAVDLLFHNLSVNHTFPRSSGRTQSRPRRVKCDGPC